MKWHETDNGVRTLQSIARNLNRLTEAESITPWDLFAAHALSAIVTAAMTDEETAEAILEELEGRTTQEVFSESAADLADSMMEVRAKRKDQV